MEVTSDDNPFLEMQEANFKKSYPIIFKIIEFFRVLFGISKKKMREYGMDAMEKGSDVQVLWEEFWEIFSNNKK
ncbi:hypothetical protein PV326_006470 [Microctonus aethiopoides]|nr:hypothetical protein PV326_006470 [Microctonus aethiopoides]